MEVDSTVNPFMTDLLRESFFKFDCGRFILAEDKPGLGIELSPEALKEFAVQWPF
jgi:L-alanine-DL-glutamate epimerase-like enolase superfamily enzyme